MGSPVNLIGSNKNKNYIVNGCMRIAQRGNVAAVNNSFRYGGADRWAVAPFLTTAAGTITQADFSTGTHFKAQALFISSSTGTGTIQFLTRLEAKNVYRLNGKTVTIQMKCYQHTGAPINLSVQVSGATSPDNWAGLTTLTTQTFSIPNAVETQISFTHTFGPSDCTNGLEIRPYYTIGGALTSKNFYISDVQLEEGSVATPLETLTFTDELARCQRFYCRFSNTVNANAAWDGTIIGTSHIIAADNVRTRINFPVAMRTYPTLLFSAASDVRIIYAGTATSAGCSQLYLNNTDSNFLTTMLVAFLSTSVFNPTANGAGMVMFVNGNSGWIAFDAEL